MRRYLLFFAFALSLAACRSPHHDPLARELPRLGHRNWILVADSAYPAQVAPGVRTVHVGGDHLALARRVLAAIDAAPHVEAEVRLDRELGFVAEADAPGIDALRAGLAELLAGRPVEHAPHGDLIAEVARAAESFSVLVLKSDGTLPYTTLFLRLDCGYWNEASEARLRDALERAVRRESAPAAPGSSPTRFARADRLH